MSHAFKWIHSPVGELKLVASHGRLTAILWKVEKPGRVVLGGMYEDPADPTLVEVERQLREYFGGSRKAFDLELGFRGTSFQLRVWETLTRIPFGETRTYASVAEELGSSNGARAVGAANGRNPIAIIAPCHRLVGTSGGMHGFAGGLEAKETLLSLESETFATRSSNGRKVFVAASGYTPASWVTR